MRRAATRKLLALLLAAVGCAAAAEAPEARHMRLSDGTDIAYTLILPDSFQEGRTYPALLALPGGRQNTESVQAALGRFWGPEAARRGFIVFSPAAPAGKAFYNEGADLVFELVRRLLVEFRIEGGKLHLAGHSNGGVSAFAAAVRHPELFRSLTVLAAFPLERRDFDRLDTLRALRVSMFVGERDLDWKEGMEKTRDRLAAAGVDVRMEVVPGNGHLLPALSFANSARIFDQLDRRGARQSGNWPAAR